MEHIIPKWLIEYTGDPKRKANFGIDFTTGKLREYSFDQFKFPACDKCNHSFSALESEVKDIVINITEEKPISSMSFSRLLSWFDKVRVGLWHGFIMLDKNILGISPNFHIDNRIDVADRALLIYKTDDGRKGIQFLGVNFPCFTYHPVCFCFMVNQFYFVNISTDLLLTKQFGLPYSKNNYLNKKGQYGLSMVKGKEQVQFPILKRYSKKKRVEIFQSIIKNEIVSSDRTLWSTKYARSFFMNTNYFGKVFINKRGVFSEYANLPTNDWIPVYSYSREDLSLAIIKEILSVHDKFLTNSRSFEFEDEEHKRGSLATIKLLKKFAKDIIARIDSL